MMPECKIYRIITTIILGRAKRKEPFSCHFDFTSPLPVIME